MVGIESLTCTHFSRVRIQVKVMHNVHCTLYRYLCGVESSKQLVPQFQEKSTMVGGVHWAPGWFLVFFYHCGQVVTWHGGHSAGSWCLGSWLSVMQLVNSSTPFTKKNNFIINIFHQKQKRINCHHDRQDWLVVRGDEGVLKATMQVDSVGVKEQPKLKKVRNIIIIFITRTIQTDY